MDASGQRHAVAVAVIRGLLSRRALDLTSRFGVLAGKRHMPCLHCARQRIGLRKIRSRPHRSGFGKVVALAKPRIQRVSRAGLLDAFCIHAANPCVSLSCDRVETRRRVSLSARRLGKMRGQTVGGDLCRARRRCLSARTRNLLFEHSPAGRLCVADDVLTGPIRREPQIDLRRTQLSRARIRPGSIVPVARHKMDFSDKQRMLRLRTRLAVKRDRCLLGVAALLRLWTNRCIAHSAGEHGAHRVSGGVHRHIGLCRSHGRVAGLHRHVPLRLDSLQGLIRAEMEHSLVRCRRPRFGALAGYILRAGQAHDAVLAVHLG